MVQPPAVNTRLTLVLELTNTALIPQVAAHRVNAEGVGAAVEGLAREESDLRLSCASDHTVDPFRTAVVRGGTVEGRNH